MLKDKLFKPAVSIMNRLPFKVKLFASTSILFILLVMPSRTTFMDYITKNDIYNNQLIGLEYDRHIHDLIQSIQLHRGLSNTFLHGNKSFKDSIVKSEKKIEKNIATLIDYDKKHFNTLNHNKDFANALSSLELVRFNTFKDDIRTPCIIFKKHSEVVSNLIRTLNDISIKSSFANSEDKRINYIAKMLQEKLLLLEENTGKLRGIASGIFAEQKITKEQKDELLSLYTLINSLESYINNNQILKDTDDYLKIQKNTALLSYKLKGILNIVNKYIILKEKPSYSSKKFFSDATDGIKEQLKLYELLSDNYNELVLGLKEKKLVDFTLVLVGFLLIVVFSFYIFGAFYHSVAKSIKKLHTATHMIAEGKEYIQLQVDTNDEIGEALLAFNKMSKKLNQNISFLDGYKMAIDETSIVSKTNPKGIITYVNKKFCEISGYEEIELIGHSHNIVRHQEMPKEAFKELWSTIKSKNIWHGVVKNRKKDGGYYIVDATIVPVIDNNGDIVEFIGVRHDITELEKSKEEIKKQKIDVLTGLPNRKQLIEDLEKANRPIVAYLNIDDFGALNEFYGSKMGDNVISHLSKLLQHRAQRDDFKLYKMYADEFVLFFEEGRVKKDNINSILSKIITNIESDMTECDGDSCVSILVSGGVAFYDEDIENIKLISNAVIARKAAKNQNKKFLTFSEDMINTDDYANNIRWINNIKDALDDNRFVTFYQPIIDNKTGAITKYESLVRMIDLDGKVISPYFFLDIAKKAKLYTKITRVVVDKAFDTFKELPQYEFSVNITVEDILDKDISKYILERVESFPHPEKIIFEITESEEIKNYENINIFIKKLKHFGVKIAIDDFGSGYANFDHIISLDADYIKVDGSLIKNIDKDESSKIITEAIIAFSKKLGSKTVVEYVHNEKVYEIVKSLGADFSQGFYLGEPNPKIVSIEKSLSSIEI